MKCISESGIEAMIKKRAGKGIPVFAICGGYQMLGIKISDPLETENGGSIDGMNLLDCTTVFVGEKKQSQTKGKFLDIEGFFSCLSGAEFSGYEIHMGVTENNGKKLTDCGGSYNGNVYGCYVHGIFDTPDVSERIVRRLFESKGIKYTGEKTDRYEYKEKQFDILANNVRNNINMDLLYKIIENGVK